MAIGNNAWLIKNSWGNGWGQGGYAYIMINDNDLNVPLYITGNVSSVVLDDVGIICEDADGDGYYFWGLGPKPASCPSWVPDTPDGDDSDINSGPIDSYGFLDELPTGVTVKTFTNYAGTGQSTLRYGIVNGGTLNVTGSINMSGNAQIRVCEGGTLIVDGGFIQNADIQLMPGCTVIVKNNGSISMASGKSFEAPVGAIVNVEGGTIN